MVFFKKIIITVIELLGIICVIIGIGMVYLPLAVIAAGVVIYQISMILENEVLNDSKQKR